MLVMSLKLEDKVVIDDNIEIVILKLGNGKVKIGFNAPKSVPIKLLKETKEIEVDNLPDAIDDL